MKKNNFLKRIMALLVAFAMVLGTITPGLVAKAADFSQLVDFTVEVPTGRDIKVLQFTDTQIIDAAQAREGRTGVDTVYWATNQIGNNAFKYITQAVNSYQPDLILVTGDLVYGEFDDNGTSLLRLIDFMESLNVKWAPVFGNHEAETTRGIDWVCEQLEAAPNCLFKQGNLTGNSNYSVGLVQGDKLVRVFYMLDSNGSSTASAESMANGQTKKAAGFGQDQIDWYTESINTIKEESPDTKFSMAFHIQMNVWAEALAAYGYDEGTIAGNPINLDENTTAQAKGDFGYVGRKLKNPWDADKTVFNGAKALGVDSMFVGHEHCNSASVMYEGVRLTYGLKTGVYDRANYKTSEGTITSSYADAGDPIVGGTAINVGNDGAITDTYHIYYKEIIETTTTVTPDSGKTDIKNPALVDTGFAQTDETPNGYTGNSLYKAENVANNASMGMSFGDTNVEGKKVYLKYYIPSYALAQGQTPAWKFYANEVVSQPAEPEPNPEPTGETIPTGLTKLTFSDWGWENQSGKINLTSTTTKNLDNTVFSGYITFNGSGQYIHYGDSGQSAWGGIRIRYNGTDIYVSANDQKILSLGGAATTTAVKLTPAGAGLSTFGGTKILLQMTLEKVGSDLKLGMWFNGKLYENSYITITGLAGSLGGYFNILNSGTVDIESYTYTDPQPEPTEETIPTGLTKLTFSDWGWENQSGKINLTSTTTKNLENTVFSGYITFNGSGQYIHYGDSGQSAWGGIRIRYNGTDIYVSANDQKILSLGGAATTTTVKLTPAGAGLSTFGGTKILLQMTLEKVGSDLKLGMWFNGKLYENSYITISGLAGSLGGYFNILNSGTVDIESYTYTDPQPEPTEETIPTGLTKLTFSDWGWENQSGKINLTSTTTKNLENTVFSGYITFNGSGQYIHYGDSGQSAWGGIRIRYNGTDIYVSANDQKILSLGGAATTTTVKLTPAGAGLSTFGGTKILLQMTLETVGSDLKLGMWFNGKLYENSYITISGLAGSLGGYFNILNSGTVDIESYTYTDPTVDSGLTFYKATGIEFDKWSRLDVTSQLANFMENDGTLKDFVLAYSANGSENATVYFDGFDIVETTVSPEWTAPLTPLYATFKADGVVVGEPIPFEANADSLTNVPTVPEKQGYIGTWEAYTLGTTDIVVNAYYEDGAIQQIPTGLTKLTFSDWGWKNKEAAYWETSGTANTVEGAIFSGKVTFHGDSMFIHYGATGRNEWDGIRLNYNGTNLVVSANDANVLSVKGGAPSTTITLTPEKAGVEAFKDTQVLLQMTLEKSGSNLKLGMWFDGVLYDNTYITLLGMADSLGGYMNLFQPVGDQAQGNVDIESYIYTDPDPEPEDPEELPTGLIGTTFSDWNIRDGEYDFKNSTFPITVEEMLFTGYVTFKENGTSFMYGGKEAWQGFRITSDKANLKFDYIDAGQTPITIYPTVAGVGSSFLNKRFLMQLTTQVVDSDNDGKMDDVKFGLWIDGKLYDNKYFIYEDASKFLGTRIFLASGKLLVESDPNHVKPDIKLPATRQPDEGLKEITFSSFGIEDGDYTEYNPKDFWVSGRYYDMEKGFTLNNTLFKGKVKFSADGVTRIYYGGSKDNAWGGVTLFSSKDGNLIVADTQEGSQYAKTIEPQHAGCALTDEWLDIMMSVQYVDSDDDGEKDDFKFGLWINERLYQDEYFIIENLAGVTNSYMGLYGPEEASGISVQSAEIIGNEGELPPTQQPDEGLTEVTFSSFGIKDGDYTEYNPKDFWISGRYYDMEKGFTLNNTLFKGRVKFSAEGVTRIYYGGFKNNAWGGVALFADGKGNLVVADTKEGATYAKVIEARNAGCTLVGEWLDIMMSTQYVDNDNDGEKDDLKFGLWLNGRLYLDEYIFINDLGGMMDSYMGLYGPEEASGISVQSAEIIGNEGELSPTQQPDEGLTEVTFSSFGIKDGDYTEYNPKDFWATGRYRDMEKGYTLDNTLFKGKVKFSTEGVTRIYYGGFKNNAWGGVALYSDGKGNLVVADTKEGATYSKVIEPRNAGCTLVGEWLDIMMSTQYVDNDNDGKKDDLKFGLWLNGRLYQDEYIYINDLGGLMGSFMGLYGPVEESAISVRSDATVDSTISLEMYGFGDDYEKQFKPEASNRIEGEPHGVLGGIFSGDVTTIVTIMTSLLISAAVAVFALRRRRSL